MIEVLLYTSLSCAQVNRLIANVDTYQRNDSNITQLETKEIVDVLKESAPECFK